ncbi:MAG: hypothetical protein JO117_03105, partial [Verrucomicrobia bacterium]|nr:hypothetical protein [Verrucomicrobiota bacterium]
AGTAAAATPSPTVASQQQEETPTPAPSVVAVNRGSSNAPVMIDVAIESFRLRHGSAQFLDAHGDVLSRLENVSLDGRVDPLPAPSVAGTTPLPQGDAATAAEKNTSRGGSGRLGCERATLRDWPAIVLTKFESAFTFRDRVLDLADGRAELAGGVAHGDFHLQTDEPGSPFSAHGRLENVSLGQLCKDLTLPGLPRFVAGRLNGTMEATGGSAGRTGKGQFRMADIQLQNLPLLQSVGDVLRIEELSQLRFKTAQFDCRVEGDTLVIEALSFVASHLRMEAHGSCQMLGGALADNVIDLQARLIVDPSVSKQLPAFVEDIFIPLENSTDGLRYLDFRISGPLGNPRNDLRDRVINRLPLQELLGGGSNNRESNNRRARGGATPTPSPSPTSGRRGGGNGNNNNRGGRPTPPTPPTPTPTPAAAAASPKAN